MRKQLLLKNTDKMASINRKIAVLTVTYLMFPWHLYMRSALLLSVMFKFQLGNFPY